MEVFLVETNELVNRRKKFSASKLGHAQCSHFTGPGMTIFEDVMDALQ